MRDGEILGAFSLVCETLVTDCFIGGNNCDERVSLSW